MPLTLAAYALVAIYLPVWLAALGAVVNVATDAAGMILMRDLDPLVQRGRYRAIWALHFVMQACYAAVAALIWQRGANFSDAFAMGMAMTTLLHVSTVRAIHLPFGLAALAGTAIPVLAGNAWRWAPGGQWSILVLSTTCALVGLAYVLAAMVMTNRLYRDAAVGRAAAQAGFEAKNRFLAQMSHELRTPLNAILGMGHAELRRNRDELSRERLSVLISAAEGLSTILDDVLDMAAVQEGRIPLRPTTAIPLEEIRSTVALFRPGVEAAGLALGLDLAGGLSRPARFDAQRLRQCLSNLLSNALKNTVAGRIDVTARIEGRAGQGAVLVLCVADTGPGIPAHLRERIFEPFRPNRAEAQGRIAAMPGSNGLGLSISQALARQMGGDLVLGEADGGPGARFVLTLALGADAGGADAGGSGRGRGGCRPTGRSILALRTPCGGSPRASGRGGAAGGVRARRPARARGRRHRDQPAGRRHLPQAPRRAAHRRGGRGCGARPDADRGGGPRAPRPQHAGHGRDGDAARHPCPARARGRRAGDRDDGRHRPRPARGLRPRGARRLSRQADLPRPDRGGDRGRAAAQDRDGGRDGATRRSGRA